MGSSLHLRSCGSASTSPTTDFIRTTEPRHIKVVQEIFQRLYDNGRHLQGIVRRMVLHPVRDILGREPVGRRETLSRLRPARRVGGGGELFLPDGQVRSQAPGAHRGQPRFHPTRKPQERSGELHQERAGGSIRLEDDLRLGRAGALRSQARHLRVDRCAHQLPHGVGYLQDDASLPSGGRPTATSWGKTSFASTPSSGRRSSRLWACHCPSASTPTGGC